MKLLTIQNYILLIDEKAEIKAGDIAVHDFGMGCELEIPCDADNLRSNTRHKVMAYYPLTKEAKELDLPLLPNPFKVVDVEKLALKYYPIVKDDFGFDEDENQYYRETWIEGYKVAQSKQFSSEDIKKAIEMAREYEFIMFGNGETEHMYSENEIIQSLSTQQLPKEFILEYYTNGDMIVKNRNGIRELVGTYKY